MKHELMGLKCVAFEGMIEITARVYREVKNKLFSLWMRWTISVHADL